MPLIVGVDLGTTKVTAVAVDVESGQVVARATEPTVTSARDCPAGRAEWDAAAVLTSGVDCLTQLGSQLGTRASEVLSLGVTGQQHGMVLIDRQSRPVSPFVGWQDQRCNEPMPGTEVSWVEAARQRLGAHCVLRTGCRLNSGFMAATLFWLHEQSQIPPNTTACFLMDLFVVTLTAATPVTDPTVAASAGVLQALSRQWDLEAIAALGLGRHLFPEVREADAPAGRLSRQLAAATGLPPDIPVSVPIGDHQASFLGSISEIRRSILLNVGTGAQVAVFTPHSAFAPPIELRPFPISGSLLSNVGLAGGWSFQVIEQFLRQIGGDLFAAAGDASLYDTLVELAEQAEPGCGGLECMPTFSGTRTDPDQAGSFSHITPGNLTPSNFARAVLVGMARNYRQAWDQILAVAGHGDSPPHLVGAGNGLRDNRVLAAAVSDEFGAAPIFTRHREEAAFGAALVGSVAAGAFDCLESAGCLVRYET